MEESYRTIEEKEVITTVQRAQSSLNTDQRNLRSVTRDYSAWTETLLFAQGQNPDWIEMNTGNDFFERFGIQGERVFNTSKELIFSKGDNSSLQVNEDLPESPITEIRDLIDPSAILESEEGTCTILDSTSGPVIVSSHPILSDAFEGPAGPASLSSF
jgi:sensor domain CHASE-containing protein